MPSEKTFSIVKPDAIANHYLGKIIDRFEQEGLSLVAGKLIHMTKDQAEGFYAEHSERPFFGELVEFMTSGPCFVQVLQGEGAIARNREIMGATNPDQADEGTLRKVYAESMGRNAVHGSDSPESAKREIAFFFDDHELVSR